MVVLLHVLLYLLEGFPLTLVLVGVACHLCYGSLLTTFPIISLCSMGFIGGTGRGGEWVGLRVVRAQT